MAFVQIDSRAVADLAHHVRTADNIDAVNDLALSQEGASGTHKTTRQIARETGEWDASYTKTFSESV